MKQYLSLIFLIIFYSCSGQEKPNAIIEKKNSGTSSVVNGYSPVYNSSPQIDEYVVEVFEDSKGKLWFGTMARGAACYDRKENKLYYFTMSDGLCDNTVVSIAEDKQGNIWFGTHNGASRLSIGESENKFTSYRNAEGIHGPGCKMFVDSKGNIWAGTNHGAFRFNGKTFSRFEIPNPDIEKLSYKWVAGKIWSIMEDKSGNIWFGRDGFGATKYDAGLNDEAGQGKKFTHFTKKDGLCSNNVTSIVEDNEGNLWFGSLSSDAPVSVNEGGLTRYDGKTFMKFEGVAGLLSNDIYTIYKNKEGHIWIGAVGVGAYRYSNGKFTLFNETDRNDLVVNFGIQSILEDRNKNLWFGFSGGLFRFNGTGFTNITQDGPW